MPWKPNELMGSHFMLLLLIFVLHFNVIYIYIVSCNVEINLYNLCNLNSSSLFWKTIDLFDRTVVF